VLWAIVSRVGFVLEALGNISGTICCPGAAAASERKLWLKGYDAVVKLPTTRRMPVGAPKVGP